MLARSRSRSAAPFAAIAVVLAVGVIALAARVAYFTDHRPVLYYGVDAAWYSAVGHSFATGHLGAVAALGGGRVISLRFPPAFPAVLAVGERVLFWMSVRDAQLWTCAVLGAVAASATAAFVLQVCSRATTGVRLALAVAAGLLLALNPSVVGTTATLMSESLFMAVVAGALVAADRLVTTGSWRAGVVLGVLVALGALTRGEGIVVLGALAVTAVVVARRRTRRALRPGVVALGMGALALVGWSAFASFEAGRPVVLSTNGGSLALGANCPPAWSGDAAGLWDVRCEGLAVHRLSRSTAAADAEAQHDAQLHPFRLGPELPPPAQAEISRAQLNEAIAQIRSHPVRAAGAVPHRLARGLGVSTSSAQRSLERFEGRIASWETKGRWLFAAVVLPLSVVGAWAVLAQRSRAGAVVRRALDPVRLAPMLVTLAVWLVVTMATYGSTRFRATADPPFAVLATVGGLVLVVGAVRLSGGRRRERAVVDAR